MSPIITACLFTAIIFIFVAFCIDKNIISFKSKKNDPIDTSKITTSFEEATNTINNMNISTIIASIVQSAKLFHKANDIMLTSNWYSSFDDNVMLELKIYDSSTIDYKLIHKGANNTLILHGNNKNCVFDSVTPDEFPALVMHLNSILDNVTDKITKKSKLSIQAHALVWFKSKSFALATYPSHNDSFKLWDSSRLEHNGLEGRFFITDFSNLDNLIISFPDADLIEIYNISTGAYDSFNTEDISKIFVF